jgi:hypothetical protein
MAGGVTQQRSKQMYQHLIDMAVCDDCHKPTNSTMIEIYWASGNRHYCQECWPKYRDYYEDESGRDAWERQDNYYAPRD